MTATLTQILEDAVQEQAHQYIAEFESFDEGTNRYAKKHATDKKFVEQDRKQLENAINDFLTSK